MAALGILLVAFLLRAVHLGAQELWLDESFSFHDATAVAWLAQLPRRDMPPLYTVVLRGWMAVGGTSEAGLRLLSALLGTAFVGTTMLAARELGGRRAVVPAGAIAAVAPLHVYYSQEARPYALLVLLLSLHLWLVAHAVTRDRARDWVPVTVVATAVLYTHYLGAIGLVATVGLVALRPSRRIAARWAAALGAALLLFVPWVVASFVLTAHSLAGLEWIREAWARTPPWAAIPRSLELFVVGPRAGLVPISLKQFDTLAFPETLRWLAIATAAALALWLAVPAGGAAFAPAPAGRRVAAAAVALLLPLLGLFVVSLAKPIYLVGRYDMLAFPAFPVLGGMAFAKLLAVGPRGRALAGVAAAALLLSVAVKLARYHAGAPAHPGKSAAAADHLTARLAGDDVVLFTDLRGHLILYQLVRRGWTWRGRDCEDWVRGMRVGCHDFYGPVDAAARGDRAPLRAAVAEAVDGYPGTVFVVHGTWAVGADGPLLLPGDTAVIEELGRLGYRPAAGDWEVGITEHRRP